MRRGGKRRAAHSRNSVSRKAPLRTCNRTKLESAPRVLHTQRTIVFHPIKRLAVFSLRLLHAGCVACRDPFGISRLLGLERSRGTRDPTIVLRGSGLPNVTCKVQASLQDTLFYILHFTFYILPARWWAQGAAHQCQRSDRPTLFR